MHGSNIDGLPSGVNPNVLLPIGRGSYEPLSSQAHMTGIAVSVRAAERPLLPV